MTQEFSVEQLRHRLIDRVTILDGRSEQNLCQLVKFLHKVETSSPMELLLSLNKDRLSFDDFLVTIIRLYDLSLNWHHSVQNHGNFTKGAIRIIMAETIDEFEKLDTSKQQGIWDSYYLESNRNPIIACADKAFIKLLTETGFPVQARQLLVPNTVAEYIQTAKMTRQQYESERSPSRKVDYSLPNDEFLYSAQKYLKTYHKRPISSYRPIPNDSNAIESITLEPYRTQILIMLRAIYGEDKVLDVLERFSTSTALLCPNEMIDLLEDWESLHQFPAEWIAQIRHLEHTR